MTQQPHGMYALMLLLVAAPIVIGIVIWVAHRK